jgi:ATP-dependent Lon protease
MSSADETRLLPVLPIRSTVLYPLLVMPLSVGREGSVAAVEAAVDAEDKALLVVAQRSPEIEEPALGDLFPVGTEAVIKRLERSQAGIQMIVQGVRRLRLLEVQQTRPYLRVSTQIIPEPEDAGPEVEALHRSVIELAAKIHAMIQPQAQVDIGQLIANVPNPLHQVYLLASMMNLTIDKEQALLEAPTRLEALRLMHEYLVHESQVVELRQKIATQAQTEMSKEQREYLLRQQLRAIQQELGETTGEQAEAGELRQRLEKAALPDEARKEAQRELDRLERLPAAAPDYQITRSYIEFILELPWNEVTEDNLDLLNARHVLDEDHYDLADVKDRIVEHLAVLKLNPGAKAPILCFVGPPGVGKTSLGQSMARALGRKFERMSLGGMHDEAELRGHRRTYIGAMPGRILQAIRRAGVKNPMLMLDEVDKLGRDFRGDPASALLEVLDPAQNYEFRDNYLNLPFDLSKVFFVTTANTLDTIPRPLLDRMEILRLAGYSEEEKLNIARRYLVPRQMKEAGLSEEQVEIPDVTITRVISGYTREAGVRNLERALGRIMRKVAIQVAQGKTEKTVVTAEMLPDMLGPERFFEDQARRELPSGVAVGMAWTETGGEVLYIEAVLLPEARDLTLTGQLGEVMRESARAAQSYAWSHADALGISHERLKSSGVHIHVPAGAIPKDGPSAGVAMATAVISLYTGLPARADTAMTGEITLTGLVLPVGGIKEKVLAARRAGLKRVILPRQNQADLRELPENIRQELEFILVDRIDEVLAAAIPEIELAPTRVQTLAGSSGQGQHKQVAQQRETDSNGAQDDELPAKRRATRKR